MTIVAIVMIVVFAFLFFVCLKIDSESVPSSLTMFYDDGYDDEEDDD